MSRSFGVVSGALLLAAVFPLACDHAGPQGPREVFDPPPPDSGTGGSGQGGADGGGSYDAAVDQADSSTQASTVGFSCMLDCSGPVLVYLGVRPPQTAGSDVISWNAVTASGEPTGDQLWTYDAVNRVLVNSINNLALKVRSDKSLTLGASATDGSPLTLHTNTDGSYGLVFDDGSVVGIATVNCPGAPFVSVALGTAGYRTAYARH